MEITVKLSEREIQFLQNLQNTFNNLKPEEKSKVEYSLEDIIHIIIEHAISLGEGTQGGHI